jgi:predicted nucleic acid-binding protein
VTELRYGALKAGWGDLRRRGLELDLAQLVIVQPDDKLMQVCADLRSSCELAGHPPGQNVHESDRWIAATAIALDTDLVSDDTIFRDVPGLAMVSRPT